MRYADANSTLLLFFEIDNGVRLGWLIDPINKQVEIYRIDRSPELISNPKQIEGENVLSGFILNLNKIL